MKTIFKYGNKTYLTLGCLFIALWGNAQQAPTSPQVNFTQRTAVSTPSQAIYNITGDFTLLGNTNLTLNTYGTITDNEGNAMQYVDIDGDSTTLNSSMATLELSNGGENGANQNCSNILFAGLYWTGKSDDANETFNVTKTVQTGTQSINTTSTITNGISITNTSYTLNITRGGSPSHYPIYTFTSNNGGSTYVFSYTNAASPATITLSINGGSASNIPVTIAVAGTATLTTPYTIVDGTITLTINQLIRNTATNLTIANTQSTSSAVVNVSGTIPVYSPLTKNYNKKVVSLKGPGASGYTTITTSSSINFPGASNSGIFIGYQEVTDYVKTHGPGAYTVADIALIEGTNANPGYSGGWGMVVIYANPLMKSRAVTLFDGYAYVNGQLAAASPYTAQGEYGTIPISGFTTVGSGQVNMKLGVMAAEGDIALTGDYLAVQKLNADPAVYPGNYLALSHANNTTTNFFDSSIFPTPTASASNPNLQNNTGVDFSMFTIPNASNSIIGNNQTSTTFRFGSSSDVYTIFGFAMSVDAYIPQPKGLISVNSINNVTNPPVLYALPGQTINYSLNITNEGTEATNNTIITIPIPATAIFHTGTISYHSYPYSGFTPTNNVPVYNSGTNTITWDLGILPIKSGTPGYKFYDISFTLDVTTDCSIILNAGCNPVVSLETGTITGTGATSGAAFTKYFFQGYDTSSCHLPITGSIQVAINGASCTAAMAGPDQVSACGGENVTLAATSGTAGTWSIVSGPSGGGEVFSNSTSPTSGFYSLNPGVYTLRWTSTSCGAHYDDVLATISLCNVVNFDGIDDNINFKNNFNLNSGNFSIEAWVKSNAVNGNTQTILSKHLTPSSTDGYDLRLVNNFVSFNWNNNSIVATHAIDTNRWYHIAATFDGTNYQLYIDGILDKTASGANPTSNSVDFILGAMSQNTSTPYNYYNGYTDELRIWNVSLTADQIRQTMNQRIANDGSGNIVGVIVPKNISGISWANLVGYYQMQTSNISNGYLVDVSGNSKNGKLKNIYVQEPNTAPIPYTSGANGNWEDDATWTNYPVWDVPYSLGVDGATKISWNIVKTTHNVTSNYNKIVLGLLVNSNTINTINDSKIEISSYLKLDGKIHLGGKSQLVQTLGSDLDVTSAGSIERDQQGQINPYDYNYWCSPVSPVNITSNNTNYTVDGVLKDGTTSIPQNINWIGGYDGAATAPISLARYWLFTFDNYINTYANWNQILETTPIRVGQGFTMKGPGATLAGAQNYTFTGKPNNGTITNNSVASDQLLLTGNPYPSALNKAAFIADNANSIDGTLYFWEHYESNNSHILRDYEGGYAALNLTAGVAPTAAGVDYISQLGSPSKGIPNQYIPVGQGFFVNGRNDGLGNGDTTIYFNNSQRGFQKEDNLVAGGSNPLYKTMSVIKNSKTGDNNNNDPVEIDNYRRVRLGYNSNIGSHRQVVLGFMNEKATDGMDYGYDALIMDDLPDDMFLMVSQNRLVIEGVGFFNTNASYPIGVRTDVEGKVSFLIDALENFDPGQAVFIYDNVTDTYHDIRTNAFEVILPIGENDSRFSLRFSDKTLGVAKVTNTDCEIKVKHIQKDNMLEINNKALDIMVEKVTLFNILGQSIATWKTENMDQQNIQIPIKGISSGVYIAKVKTSNGEINKKIVVQ